MSNVMRSTVSFLCIFKTRLMKGYPRTLQWWWSLETTRPISQLLFTINLRYTSSNIYASISVNTPPPHTHTHIHAREHTHTQTNIDTLYCHNSLPLVSIARVSKYQMTSRGKIFFFFLFMSIIVISFPVPDFWRQRC